MTTLARFSASRFCSLLALGLTLSCGQNYKIEALKSDLSERSDRADNPKLDSNSCQENKVFDSCIFQKNPVFQKKAALQSIQDSGLSTELTELLTTGVQISNQTQPSTLDNASIQVRSANGNRASPLPNGAWKFPLHDTNHSLAQVMAYYYANFTINRMQQTTGRFYAADRRLQVVTGSSQTGWSSTNNQIDLQSVGTTLNTAFDASILVFLLGQANFHYATLRPNENPGVDQNHKNCGPPGGPVYLKDCCTSKDGCFRAISVGTSDYLVALVFPDAPTVGELITNRTSGLGFCGISRDLRLAPQLTASEVFNACGSSAQGEIYPEGTLYASVWWEIRKKLQAAGEDVALFDKLYMEHLQVVSSNDTFLTLLPKIQTLDRNMSQSKFYPLFVAEYRKRGLN